VASTLVDSEEQGGKLDWRLAQDGMTLELANGVNTFNTLPNFRRTKWATNI